MALRRLRPAEAEQLYALKGACFPESYLGYSVFRSPKSVAHLRALAQEGLAARHPILVAGDFEGYAQGTLRQEAIHLDYIGVHPEHAGKGLGGVLLGAFEAVGSEGGAKVATLDVFASNPNVREWYRRHGYEVVKETIMSTVDLNLVEADDRGLAFTDLAGAAREEEERGFGFTAVDHRPSPLALIAGDTLRIAVHPDEAEPIARALRRDFPARPRLVLSGSDGGGLPLLDEQVSVRMEKRF